MEIHGVTICPDCESQLKPADTDSDARPIQPMTQACVECEYTTTIALLWYQLDHEIVADVRDVEHEDGIETVVVDRNGVTVDRYEVSETRAHHEAALRQIS